MNCLRFDRGERRVRRATETEGGKREVTPQASRRPGRGRRRVDSARCAFVRRGECSDPMEPQRDQRTDRDRGAATARLDVAPGDGARRDVRRGERDRRQLHAVPRGAGRDTVRLTGRGGSDSAAYHVLKSIIPAIRWRARRRSMRWRLRSIPSDTPTVSRRPEGSRIGLAAANAMIRRGRETDGSAPAVSPCPPSWNRATGVRSRAETTRTGGSGT